MNLNTDILKGKWRQVKGEIQRTWGKLTNDELEQNKGDYNAIAGLVQQRYGEGKEEVERKISDLLGRFDSETDEGSKSPEDVDVNETDSFSSARSNTNMNKNKAV